MIDANQCFTASEAVRRAAHFSGLGLGWFEEPLPADDVAGHVRLAASTHLPIAVGESLYSIGQFADYLRLGACSIVQADVARQLGVDAPIAPADGLDPAKYQQFALTDEELIFFFGQGEIMAGAGGALRAKVPRSAIADMLA